MNGVLDIVILGDNICETDSVGCKEGIPGLHDEELLRHYHLHRQHPLVSLLSPHPRVYQLFTLLLLMKDLDQLMAVVKCMQGASIENRLSLLVLSSIVLA